MRLFKYEGYKITIEPEAMLLKPFKKIWDRDKSKSKDKAMMELGFIYFFCDPRSDYQIIVDEDQRKEAIKEQEGFSGKWQPDKVVESAIEFYNSFKTPSALLLEDTRLIVDRFRNKMRNIDFESLEIKDMKDINAFIKQIPALIKDLDEAEKSLAKEAMNMGKMRGQGEKTLMEDNLNI